MTKGILKKENVQATVKKSVKISSKAKRSSKKKSSPKIAELTAEQLQPMMQGDLQLESPILVATARLLPIILPRLLWYHVLVKPRRTKITNNGHTVFVTSKWRRNVPFLRGGPLQDQYTLYNIHFHWGNFKVEGSEHIFPRERLSFEMHVLWRNEKYQTAREAKHNADGIVIIAYLFQRSEFDNEHLQPIVENLEEVKKANSSVYMSQLLPISELMPYFDRDYFLYGGSLKDEKGSHQVLWLIHRQVQPIGREQLAEFRRLLTPGGFLIERNYRQAVFSPEHTVYHVAPEGAVQGPTGKCFLIPLNRPEEQPDDGPTEPTDQKHVRWLEKDGTIHNRDAPDCEDSTETSCTTWSEVSYLGQEEHSSSSSSTYDANKIDQI